MGDHRKDTPPVFEASPFFRGVGYALLLSFFLIGLVAIGLYIWDYIR